MMMVYNCTEVDGADDDDDDDMIDKGHDGRRRSS